MVLTLKRLVNAYLEYIQESKHLRQVFEENGIAYVNAYDLWLRKFSDVMSFEEFVEALKDLASRNPRIYFHATRFFDPKGTYIIAIPRDLIYVLR